MVQIRKERKKDEVHERHTDASSDPCARMADFNLVTQQNMNYT
jgi:hypothetical protein